MKKPSTKWVAYQIALGPVRGKPGEVKEAVSAPVNGYFRAHSFALADTARPQGSGARPANYFSTDVDKPPASIKMSVRFLKKCTVRIAVIGRYRPLDPK